MTEAMQTEAVRALLALDAVGGGAPEDVHRHKTRIRFSLLMLERLADADDGERYSFAHQILGAHIRRALDFAASLRDVELAAA